MSSFTTYKFSKFVTVLRTKAHISMEHGIGKIKVRYWVWKIDSETSQLMMKFSNGSFCYFHAAAALQSTARFQRDDESKCQWIERDATTRMLFNYQHEEMKKKTLKIRMKYARA